MNGKIFKVRGDVKIIKTGEIGYIQSINDYQKKIRVIHGCSYGDYKADELEPLDIEPETFFVDDNGIYTKMCNGLDIEKFTKIKENKEEKPVRGLRIKMNLYEECSGINKKETENIVSKVDKKYEDNMYLNQKERNVIRTQLENILHSFECEVDTCLRNNNLQLAKVNHTVVDTVRGILNKIQVADCEEPIVIGTKVELLKDIVDERYGETIPKGTKGYIRDINYNKNKFEIFLDYCAVTKCDEEYLNATFKIIK